MKHVEIYTDGACKNNPGKGGYGAVLKYNEHEKHLSGAFQNTTNNRMELYAVIVALQSLNQPCEVNLFTDSQYICNAINKGWLTSWRKYGWKKTGGGNVLNVDLWKVIVKLMSIHTITFNWVKGHSNNYYNNVCDRLAVNAYNHIEESAPEDPRNILKRSKNNLKNCSNFR